VNAFDKRGIPDAITTLGIAGWELTPGENQAFRKALAEKFGTDHQSWRLWEDLAQRSTMAVWMQDRDGWLAYDEFLTTEPVFLLVDDSNEPFGFALASGRSVVPILSGTSHFEFAVTNAQLDYVVCFNSYDFLIACGTATEWLLARIAKNGP